MLLKRSFFCFIALFGLALAACAQPLNTHLLKSLSPRSIGPAGMSGRVTAIQVVERNPEVIYAGTASGGLWLSESGGIAWKPIFDDQPVASIGAIAIFQPNPDVIWVGTGEGNPRNSQSSGNGVYRSLDGGKTWRHMGLENSRNIHRIIVHPTNPDVVYVGVQGSAWGDHPDRGVFRTRDGGKTWEKILYRNERTGIADLVMDPQNPNKLIAALWEFHRDAWFFKSGGKSSGLFVTWDGGETWEERDEQDGLPKGELGRMGVAIARSNNQVVYAVVEAEKNGIYRSDDGGSNFRLINNNDEEFARPFYYAEIYVDPSNENRVYNINSSVTVSNDGGKTFSPLLPYLGSAGIHPDHHAWYILPTDPNVMLEGNDGGLSITRDKGKSWRFVENLPLAQYYHINVDMDLPYHVYGGMQDNGSWRGPAYVWRAGGIRNSYFEEVMFGDGFDVVPDPRNSEVGYAMSQGGSLGRYNLGDGTSKFIQPKHPEGKYLRFNWNAGIAMDPFDPNTIYYGSQFLHKSTDQGESWTIISPDLTTNDASKQNFLKTGGLTPDVTAAEYHTTIISVAPSPLKKDVLWVGTDDGNVQLTRDGGKTWTNVVANIPGVPAATWVPQIRPSTYNEAEAWVVFDNHRRNDWTPYAFRTKDFGKTWTKITTPNIRGYCLSVLQDPVEPKLVFVGTEFGLYVSIDECKTWTKYTEGYPTVSTIDFVIHPREADLVVATFGRAAYVFDDIRPLREIATTGGKALLDTLHVFKTPTAVITEFAQASGTRFSGDAMFQGQNRRGGAMISYAVLKGKSPAAKGAPAPAGRGGRGRGAGSGAPGGAKGDSAMVQIFDGAGQLIRTFYHLPDSGLNRIYWDLAEKGFRSPGQEKPEGKVSDNGGVTVLPGKYEVRITYQGKTQATPLEVILDPRVKTTPEALAANRAFARKANELYVPITEAMDKIRAAKPALDLISKQISPADSLMKKATSNMQDSLKTLQLLILDDADKKGYQEDTTTLLARIQLGQYLYSNAYDAPNATHKLLYQLALKESQAVLARIDRFFRESWPAYQEEVRKVKLDPFQD